MEHEDLLRLSELLEEFYLNHRILDPKHELVQKVSKQIHTVEQDLDVAYCQQLSQTENDLQDE